MGFLIEYTMDNPPPQDIQLKHFSLDEFDSPDTPGSGKKYMRKEFLCKIDDARNRAGIPFHISSGYRTEAHNGFVGGVSDSAHLKGYAADIVCKSSRQRYKMINALIKAGFTRIGIGDTFTHTDCDPSKDPSVVWLY